MPFQGMRHKYPDRKQCMDCKRYFTDIVVSGLYCSWWCAGIKEAEWVRQNPGVPVPVVIVKRDGAT